MTLLNRDPRLLCPEEVTALIVRGCAVGSREVSQADAHLLVAGRGLGLRVQGSGFRVQGSAFRVQGSGLGFKIQG
jgi:hypothetical protein